MGDQQQARGGWWTNPHDPESTDPDLLKQNSEIRTFTTDRYTYADIRIFYKRHQQADQLPKPSIPLLVFIHGLGGSVAQFHPLLTSLVHISSCLAIDLPGCGRSKFAQTSWDAYSPEAMAELLEVIIDEYRQKEPDRNVVLIGHSMGTTMCAQLASRNTTHRTDLRTHIVGLVAICPVSGPPPADKTALFRKLLWVPGWLFDLWRAYDRWGGPQSASVSRFVGPGADLELRKLQDRFNNQSRTPVWRRMAWGSLPTFKNGVARGGVPGKDVWAGVDVPVYLVGGEADKLTPPGEVGKIEEYLQTKAPLSPETGSEDGHETVVDSAAPVNTLQNVTDHVPESIDDIRDEDFQRDRRLDEGADTTEDPSTPDESSPANLPPQPRHPTKVVKSIIIPAPANHALLFMPSTARVLAHHISDFLACHVTGRFSLKWQLQYLSREGKWDVKNLAKWKNVVPVSLPIGPKGKPAVFRAMKTLREADDVHCPAEFVKNWGKIIKDVVDISHDQPVYDPRSMEKGGIRYHKFATVSKVPPSEGEVAHFVALVDKLREEQKKRAEEEGWEAVNGENQVIGVHCHYGFNRTGYFIVCYLVERCGLGVQEAIDTFAEARPNGIRHSHFLDKLHQVYVINNYLNNYNNYHNNNYSNNYNKKPKMNRFRVYATKTLSGTVAGPRKFHAESDVQKLAALVQSARAATERIEGHVGVRGCIVDDGRKLAGPLYRAIGFDVNVFEKVDKADVIRRKLAASFSGEGMVKGEGEGGKVLERLREVQGEMGEVLGRLEAVERESRVPVGGRGNWRGGRFLDLDCL
uniref:Dual specificity phosphatase n=1 Tax=Colletotrichum fructicola (strain Nara gc5) TaxID=1213859 RepID=L2G766_COLFN